MTNSNKLPRFKFEKYVPSVEGAVNASRWNRLVNHRFFRGGMGLVAGALVGLLYWKFVGCQSGTCPLTSNPYKSVLIFSFMGLLMAKEKSSGRAEVK
jgi:hypothetical protein